MNCYEYQSSHVWVVNWLLAMTIVVTVNTFLYEV